MLSKVENGQRSLTYDKLIKLAESLSVDISRLFTNQAPELPLNLHAGRRSVQRIGDGFVIEAGVYTYTYLANDLVSKRFLPVLMDLHARSVDEFDGLLRHQGEEFALVLEGEVDVCTEVYAPLRLKAGESVFFESTVGHAYINAGTGAARLMVIASDATAGSDPTQLPVAQSARNPASDPRRGAHGASDEVQRAGTASSSATSPTDDQVQPKRRAVSSPHRNRKPSNKASVTAKRG
jgi:transcriptional regulator with XRE-family HTH domain